MRLLLTVICCSWIALYSCKLLQTTCRHAVQVPVVIVGKDGSPHTVYVPFCDTLQLKSAAIPDTITTK